MTGRVVLYGIGSPLVGDVEESAHRAGLAVACGIANVEGGRFLAAGTPVLGPGEAADDLKALPFLVPLFTPGHRQAAAQEAARVGFAHPAVLIDPTSVVPRALEAGPGTYVNAACVVGAGCGFGDFTLINRGANIGHHARLGRFVSIGPGVVIAGAVTLGDGAVVGSGAVILPGMTVGENAVVGAGSVVTRPVEPGALVAGNPARIVRRTIGGYKGASVT